MSIAPIGTTPSETPPQPISVPAAEERVLQRLATVRRLQGLSRRTVARRLNLDVEEVRRQENQSADISLSALYAWQRALEVPVAELLTDVGSSLVSPILERSQLVRLMKTVLAVREQAKQESIRRMAQTMIEQLTEIMPELADVGPWHAVGKRRRLNELGVAAQRHLAEDVFLDHD
jgi:transcriptional regulator with XRE-family HTH domain